MRLETYAVCIIVNIFLYINSKFFVLLKKFVNIFFFIVNNLFYDIVAIYKYVT